MPSSKRKYLISVNKPRGKKPTQFKPGHKPKVSVPEQIIPDNPTPDAVPAANDSVAVKQLLRLTTQEAQDAAFIGGSQGVAKSTELPYTLRPKPETEQCEPENEENDENVIIHVQTLSELLSHMHAATSEKCANSNVQAKIIERKGLCVYMSIQCGNCNYKSPVMPMTETVKPKRGPDASVLNSMLMLPVLKSKVGLEDVSNVLTCLNIKAPSKTTMQAKLDQLADTAIELNEKQMLANQKYVKRMLEMTGSEPAVDVQFDVAYTNRPQAGCETAAQSYGALIEHTTTRKLPIAISTANKHCRKRGCSHSNCMKNFPSEASISTSERVLLHDTLRNVQKDGNLEIGSITTDAGTQSAKAIRDCQSHTRLL